MFEYSCGYSWSDHTSTCHKHSFKETQVIISRTSADNKNTLDQPIIGFLLSRLPSGPGIVPTTARVEINDGPLLLQVVESSDSPGMISCMSTPVKCLQDDCEHQNITNPCFAIADCKILEAVLGSRRPEHLPNRPNLPHAAPSSVSLDDQN